MNSSFFVPPRCLKGIARLGQELRLLLTSSHLRVEQINALSKLYYGVSRLPLPTDGVDSWLEIQSADDPRERRSFHISLSRNDFHFNVWHLETAHPEGNTLIEDFSFTCNTGSQPPDIDVRTVNKFIEWIGAFSRAVVCALHPRESYCAVSTSGEDESVDWTSPSPITEEAST